MIKACGKANSFDSMAEARAYLRFRTSTFKGLRVPIRAYECKKCRKFYVTSKPRRKRNG